MGSAWRRARCGSLVVATAVVFCVGPAQGAGRVGGFAERPVSALAASARPGWLAHLAALSGIGAPVPPLVAIDPGHGGRDPGATGPDGVHEKHWTLELAKGLQACLRGRGLRAELSRAADRYVSLRERADWANRLRADLFVSIHLNALAAGRQAVLEVYTPEAASVVPTEAAVPGPRHWMPFRGLAELLRRLREPWRIEASARLARHIHHGLAASSDPAVADRGVKAARFAVLLKTAMPAVLLEPTTLSDPAQAARLHEPEFRQGLVQALCERIDRFLAR